jgi:hypothetical protein
MILWNVRILSRMYKYTFTYIHKHMYTLLFDSKEIFKLFDLSFTWLKNIVL